MLENIADFIKKELSEEIPWHISAFSPYVSWKLKDIPSTSLDLIHKTREIGLKRGLKNVYAGNV